MLFVQIAANAGLQAAATLNHALHFHVLTIEHVGQRLGDELSFGREIWIESPDREISFLHDAREARGGNPTLPKFLRRNFDNSLMRSFFSTLFVSHFRELPESTARPDLCSTFAI